MSGLVRSGSREQHDRRHRRGSSRHVGVEIMAGIPEPQAEIAPVGQPDLVESG